MKAEELKKVLENHKLWINDEGGQRADLRGADLWNAYLQGADLRNANLRNANLRGAMLPMYCKWSASIIDGNIKIGCETKSPEGWVKWLESEEEFETKRGTDDFKRIEAVIRAHIEYLKYLP